MRDAKVCFLLLQMSVFVRFSEVFFSVFRTKVTGEQSKMNFKKNNVRQTLNKHEALAECLFNVQWTLFSDKS